MTTAKAVPATPDYLKFADMLAPLSCDEIILISRMMTEDSAWNAQPEPSDERPTVWHMVTTGELSSLFESQTYLEATAGRAVRSGLIIARSVWGGLAFEPSPQGRRAREFLNIEAAVHPSGWSA